MSDEEHKQITDGIMLSVIKEFRTPLYALVGIFCAQLISFVGIGIVDHFTLQGIAQIQKEDIKPKVDTMWDDHWAYIKKP